MIRSLSLITGLLFAGPALADRPEAGAMVGATHFAANGYGAGGWAVGVRGGYRMEGGLTPEATLSTHMTDAYDQVVLGAGVRYYFMKVSETWQPFAIGHLAYATKSPGGLGLTTGGGAIYRINRDFFAEALASYHLTLDDTAFNITTIGLGGGMKF
jgi:hypothetical protein